MAFTRGTATGYRDLADKLDKFLTNRHVSAVAINAAGTGYVVGDLLSVAGGTVEGSMTARLEVTTVGGAGEITGIRVYDAGAYSVDPTTTANAVTGGTGSGATMDLTMAATGWTNRIRNISAATSVIEVQSGSIGIDGSGYSLNDIVTLDDPVVGVSKAKFRVTAVDGSGNVQTISLEDAGDYDAYGTGTYSTTGGTGTGLTINPFFIPVRDEYLWEGAGTGGVPVFVGVRTGYYPGTLQHLWELAGFTGWNGSSDWESQPGISPGRNTLEPIANLNGSAILLLNSSMPFWFAASARRVIVVVNVGGNYQSAFLGLLDAYGTTTEIPYPIYICGTVDRFDEPLGSASVHARGIADPTASVLNSDSGPGFFRDGDGSWYKVWNGDYDGSDMDGNRNQNYCIFPCGQPNTTGLSDEDRIVNVSNNIWDDIIVPEKGAAASVRWLPSPDAGGDLYFPVQCVLMRSKGATTHRCIGELPGVYWVSAENGLAAEDRIIAGNRYFRVFQMGANSLSYAHFCVEEA